MFSIVVTIEEIFDLIKSFFYTFWTSMFYQKNILDQLSSPGTRKSMKADIYLIISLLIFYISIQISVPDISSSLPENKSIQEFISKIESYSKQMSLFDFCGYIIPFLLVYYGLLGVLKKVLRLQPSDSSTFQEFNKLYLGSWFVLISIITFLGLLVISGGLEHYIIIQSNTLSILEMSRLIIPFISLILLTFSINKKYKAESGKMKFKMKMIPIFTIISFVIFIFYFNFNDVNKNRKQKNNDIEFRSVRTPYISFSSNYDSSNLIFYMEINRSIFHEVYDDSTYFNKLDEKEKFARNVSGRMFVLIHNTSKTPVIIKKKGAVYFDFNYVMSINDKDSLTPFMLIEPNEMKIIKLYGFVNKDFIKKHKNFTRTKISLGLFSEQTIPTDCFLVFDYDIDSDENVPQE